MKYRVISADNHVMEPPGTFVDRLPAGLKDRAPQVMKNPRGGEGWTFNGQLPKMTFSRDASRKGGDTFAMIPRGSHDGAVHLDPLLARSGMYSTDYPHPITLWPRSSELIPVLTEGLPEDTRYNLLAGNAVRVFGLKQEVSS